MAARTSEVSPEPGPIGHFEDRFWVLDDAAPLGQRRAGKYKVFVPDRIAKREFLLHGEAVQVLAHATRVLDRLQAERPQGSSLAALARSLLRSESAASSRIEGIQISQRRLACALYAAGKGRGGDPRAAEVLGNLEAMERAVEIGAQARALRVADVLEIHRTLLRHTRDHDMAGVVRARQNWIGGSDWHPMGAAYIPPPPELVPGLLEDLCAFASRQDIAALAQAAILHAQFENIHPFADGNGRVGRALIYTVLRRRGEVPVCIPPISLALGAEPRSYVSGLGAYSSGRVSIWCERFASACIRATDEAEALARAIERQQAAWLERLGSPRRDAAVRAIVAALPATPIIDVAAGRRLTGKSHVAVGQAIAGLERVGALKSLNERRWGRVWECSELLALVEQVERRAATPSRGGS